MKKEELLNHPDLYRMIRWAMHKLNVPIRLWEDLEQEVVLRIITHSFDEKSQMSTIILRRTSWTIGDLEKLKRKSVQAINSPLPITQEYRDKFGYVDKKDEVENYLNQLDDQQRFVIKESYLHHQTDISIAEKLKLTGSRIQQIRIGAIKRFQKEI